MSYKEEIILQWCSENLSNPAFFYKSPIVNYVGRTKDTKNLYTEVISKYLFDNFNFFSIDQLDREKYVTKGHTVEFEIKEKNKDDEEILAKKLFRQSKENKGTFPFEVLDYQIPLKRNNKIDKGVGKIDLLAVDENEKIVYILELKKKSNTETILKCILEAYTYAKQVNKDTLLNDFGKVGYSLAIAPLVFEGRTQFDEMQEVSENGERKELFKLISKLRKDEKFRNEQLNDKYNNIVPFYIKDSTTDGMYEIYKG
ncbi:hypothetical protein [Butyrivibrio fibrisolvens]|uniref:hypothetical protein n=1 Tax=Butyrivibrio fibrisolvens TaxID=831 RepID=UPI0004037908|nr:hypothetical protein [Butyrivibrio fibrisolvens]